MAATEERFEVFNVESYSDYPNAVPAGRYARILDAIKHAESVTYKMGVVDTQAESRGFVYCNESVASESGGDFIESVTFTFHRLEINL